MRSRAKLREQYEARVPVLKKLSDRLETEAKECLEGLRHIDRISFRAKSVESFVAKALDPENDPPYQDPLSEVEDQLAGRILVFFVSDIGVVVEKLKTAFTPVEQKHRRPARDQEFGYESHHLICVVPPHIRVKRGTGGTRRVGIPNTFELQIRTIFMHAYSEPQHDLGYKSAVDLPSHVKRELAWIAASAWGADQALERVTQWEHQQQSGKASPSRGRRLT